MTVLALKKDNAPASYMYGSLRFFKHQALNVENQNDVEELLATGYFVEVAPDGKPVAAKKAGLVIKPKKDVVKEDGDVELPVFGSKDEIINWVAKNAPGIVLDKTKTKAKMVEDLKAILKEAKAKEAEEAPVEEDADEDEDEESEDAGDTEGGVEV